jgi:hypothetical protein
MDSYMMCLYNMWHGLDECGGFRTEHMKVVSGARKVEWSGPRNKEG